MSPACTLYLELFMVLPIHIVNRYLRSVRALLGAVVGARGYPSPKHRVSHFVARVPGLQRYALGSTLACSRTFRALIALWIALSLSQGKHTPPAPGIGAAH